MPGDYISRSVLFFSLALLAVGVQAAEYFVSPNGDDRRSGTDVMDAWRTIDKANRTVSAGDTVYLRGGTYIDDPIRPARSGTSGNEIRYVAYQSEVPVLTSNTVNGLRIAIDLSNRSYISVESIHVDGKERNPRSRVEHFVQIWNGSYNTVRDCELRFATGWRGVDLDDGAHHNRIIDNIVDFVGVYDDGQGNDWGDSIVIENAHNNLIQGNVVLHGAHNLLRVKGENNVIRGNVFDNSWSTVLAPGLGGRNLALMGRRNVFEENIVRNSGASIDKAANAGMKAEGRDNIVRRNYIYRNSSEGIMSESRSGQPYAHNNHIFHNTIYGNDGPGWRLEMYNGGNSPVGNVFKNNVVYDNRQNAFNSTYDVDVLFKLARSSTGVVAGSLIDGNLIYKQASGDAVVYIQDGGSRQDLGSAEASFRNHIRNNRISGVSFSSVDPKLPEDFDLQPGSAGIDSGLPLTHTTTSGNGTEIHVEDAGYFTDGFGVVPGDMIRVGTQSDVRVVSVRYDQNSIVVSNSVQWSAGAPVSLAYSGAAPDVGAREYGLSNNVGGPAQPRPPRQLRISR